MPETVEDARRIAALERLGLRRAGAAAPFDNAVRLGRDSWRGASGRPALGSFVDLILLARSADHAAEASARAFAELERLRAVFDRHDGASALSALNGSGDLPKAPRELTALIQQARRFSMASGAAFDITVAPLLDLFHVQPAGDAAGPAARDVAERRELVGYDRVHLEKRRLWFARGGMSVTLDGIAKGAIVDAMARVLERHQLSDWLINAGGDVRASGNSERGTPWTVAVRDPAADAALPEVITLRGGAVATSGAYDVVRHDRPDPRHIVHGSLGAFPRDCASVTVLAPSAMAADALATAVFAAGPRDGVTMIERLRCACLIVLADGRLVRSSNWKELTS